MTQYSPDVIVAASNDDIAVLDLTLIVSPTDMPLGGSGMSKFDVRRAKFDEQDHQ